MSCKCVVLLQNQVNLLGDTLISTPKRIPMTEEAVKGDHSVDSSSVLRDVAKKVSQPDTAKQ